MITAAKLAGLFAAHAVWCVSDGDLLIPMLAYTNENDERKMDRFVQDDLGAAVEAGRQKLASNEMDADDAVLLFDGRIPVDGEPCDAIIAEMRAYFAPDALAVLAAPYTPASAGPFRVHRLKLLAWENCDDFDLEQVTQSFFQGVSGHEKGSAIWEENNDDSK